jgi:hypothetical protein
MPSLRRRLAAGPRRYVVAREIAVAALVVTARVATEPATVPGVRRGARSGAPLMP